MSKDDPITALDDEPPAKPWWQRIPIYFRAIGLVIFVILLVQIATMLFNLHDNLALAGGIICLVLAPYALIAGAWALIKESRQ